MSCSGCSALLGVNPNFLKKLLRFKNISIMTQYFDLEGNTVPAVKFPNTSLKESVIGGIFYDKNIGNLIGIFFSTFLNILFFIRIISKGLFA